MDLGHAKKKVSRSNCQRIPHVMTVNKQPNKQTQTEEKRYPCRIKAVLKTPEEEHSSGGTQEDNEARSRRSG